MTIIPIVLAHRLVAIVIVMIPCWFICKKAGFSPWLSLLNIVPSFGTLVLLYVLAFASGRWCRRRRPLGRRARSRRSRPRREPSQRIPAGEPCVSIVNRK